MMDDEKARNNLIENKLYEKTEVVNRKRKFICFVADDRIGCGPIGTALNASMTNGRIHSECFHSFRSYFAAYRSWEGP